MSFQPYLFIGVGATHALFTLRETYEHVFYINRTRYTEICSYHHKNLGQDPDESFEKALKASQELKLPLHSSIDQIQKELRDIKRASKEEMETREKLQRVENAVNTINYAADNDYNTMNRLVAKGGVFNFGFGKYLGKSFANVIEYDFNYVEYMLKNDFLDELTKFQLETYIENHGIEATESEYYGEIGERYAFTAVLKRYIPFETQYGMSAVVTLADVEGNELVLFTTASFQEVGTKMTFNAKVKDHKEYEGSKQTILQRPTKITEVESENKP